jgi:hypothetical protein
MKPAADGSRIHSGTHCSQRLACRGNPEKLPGRRELFGFWTAGTVEEHRLQRTRAHEDRRPDDDAILGAMRSPLRRARLGRGQSPAYGENRICWGFSARGRRRTRAKPNRSRRNAGRPRRIRCGRRPASSRTNARQSVDSTPRSLGRLGRSVRAGEGINQPGSPRRYDGTRTASMRLVAVLSARPILYWLRSSWPER